MWKSRTIASSPYNHLTVLFTFYVVYDQHGYIHCAQRRENGASNMAKKKKQKTSKKLPIAKVSIQELQESRDGGQIALRGYSYQFLYSCNLILSSDTDTIFTLEGIEDIDTIKCSGGNKTITHIQLKFSTQRQDASFMDSVLKNYLEAYLIDKNRYFKLAYDFSIAAGNLSKLFSGNFDKTSKEFWKAKVDNIKKEKYFWNWSDFDFEDFIQRLSFENVKKDSLEKSIEDSLIENFEINTDNISLFANGIKLLCFDKMESRSEISHQELTQRIEEIKFDISKGPQNPAHAWIQRLQFSKSDKYSSDYYEGKKATPSDIANNLPVIRPTVEKEIVDSIEKNAITIIKTSSGQGKTTLALRAISLLTEEYTPYQITRCNNDAELGHIVEYFRMRTRIGEKPLILLDNLDAHLSEWNLLAQLMQTGVTYHYKLLVTSRENDWYNYGGDISNLHHLNIIKPTLSEKEAESIYWLYNIDSSMNLSSRISLNDLWVKAEDHSVKTVSSLMYSSFCGNKDGYSEFVRNNLQRIISYLKRKTNSHKIQVSDDNKKIKVEYLLRASEITKGNNESVARLTDICRSLPIFETYCSDAIKPQIDLLATYQIPNDAHKEMPKENIIITFHQEFNGLWLRTIESNYEFDTVYAWIDHWLDVRKCACDLLAASSTCLHKLLGNRELGDAGNLFDALHNRYNKMMVAHLSYPREHRPFEKKPEIPTLFNKAKRDYFDGIQNFANQLISFIKKEEQAKRLAIYNLKSALAALPNVQKFFDDITLDSEHQRKHVELCALEEKVIFETYMCCEYYLSHAPETNYNKYQVKAWFSSSRKAEIDEINSTMTDLSSIYDAVLPKSSYRDNTFLCYPILLKNFDPANEEMMNAFLITSISFAKSPYDYLLLLLTNNAGEVIPNAIKFPQKAFQYIYNAINLGVEEEMDPLASPYPIEVTEKMLECFDGEYILQKQEPTNIGLGRIADIGEELWMYSKNREYLVDEEDEQYLSNNLNAIKTRIDEIVKDINSNVSKNVLSIPAMLRYNALLLHNTFSLHHQAAC